MSAGSKAPAGPTTSNTRHPICAFGQGSVDQTRSPPVTPKAPLLGPVNSPDLSAPTTYPPFREETIGLCKFPELLLTGYHSEEEGYQPSPVTLSNPSQRDGRSMGTPLVAQVGFEPTESRF